MNTYDLVKLVKIKQNIVGTSDRSFAIKNGFNYQSVIDWKAEKSNASLSNFVKLAKLAGMSIDEMEDFANAMEKRKNFKQAGFVNLEMMLGISGISGMTLLAMSHLPYQALGALIVGTNFVYYVKLENGKLIKITPEIENQLFGFNPHKFVNLPAANDIEIHQVSTHSNNQSLIYANFRKS